MIKGKFSGRAKLTLFFLLILLSFASLFIGAKDISFTHLLHQESLDIFIFFISRIPRTFTVILAGVGLAISGLIMQLITQNKFVSPTTSGTLEAAKLGILLSIMIIPTANIFVKSLFTLVFTFLATLIFLIIVNRIQFKNIIFIPLVGLMLAGILNSITTFFAVNFNIVQSANTWLVGDFSSVLQGKYELVYLCIPTVLITYFYANRFTAAGLGTDMAKNIGLNYHTVILLGIFLVSLTVGTITIVAGGIPFVGLIVPNIVSLLYGDNTKKTLLYVALFGAILLLICDIVGRILIFPFEIPIGLMVGCIGGLMFLLLIIRRK